MLLRMKIRKILSASRYVNAVTRFEIVFEALLVFGFSDCLRYDFSQFLFPRHATVQHNLSFNRSAAVLAAFAKIRFCIAALFAHAVDFVFHSNVVFGTELQLFSRKRIDGVYDYVAVNGVGIRMRG